MRGACGESGARAARLVVAGVNSAPGHATTLHLLTAAVNALEAMMNQKPATTIHVLVRFIGDLLSQVIL